MTKRTPIVVAHRGLHHRCPENTLEAFIDAVKAGVPWVECDVWPSADDAIMVIHDQSIDRTTAGNGEVLQHTCRQLRDLNVLALPQLVDFFGSAYPEQRPSLLVEIKPRDARFVRLVLDELKRYPFGWMIQSFHADNLHSAWTVNPSIPAAFLVETPAELHIAAESDWPVIHSHHSAIDREVAQRLQSAGRKLGAWTVNEPDEIQRMIDLGVDMLITDEPQLALRIMAEK